MPKGEKTPTNPFTQEEKRLLAKKKEGVTRPREDDIYTGGKGREVALSYRKRRGKEE